MDPIKSGANWYVYCENNPLKFVDPAGLNPHYTSGDYIEGDNGNITQVPNYDSFASNLNIMKAAGYNEEAAAYVQIVAGALVNNSDSAAAASTLVLSLPGAEALALSQLFLSAMQLSMVAAITLSLQGDELGYPVYHFTTLERAAMIMASGRINPAYDTGHVHVMLMFNVKEALKASAKGLECAVMINVRAEEITRDTGSNSELAYMFHTPGHQYINYRNPQILVVESKNSFWQWLFGK